MAKTKTPKKNVVKKEKSLNIKQELFIRLYTQNDGLRGNATLCYADDDQVYEKYDEEGNGRGKIIEESTRTKAYNVCSVEGNRSLRKIKIQERKYELLNELLKDHIVDSRLAHWIQDNTEPSTSLGAIREYNKLRMRVVDKVDITSKGEPIKGIEYIVPEPPKNEIKTGTDV